MTKIFIFPHQDDEFGIFYLLKLAIQTSEKIYCIFLTKSPKGDVQTTLRNTESKDVLNRLGVPDESILFLGNSLEIVDGLLVDKMSVLASWVSTFLINTPQISDIYVPAWEGGHPDHDATNVVILHVVKALGKKIRLWQYPLYNGKDCWGKMFSVLKSLPENGGRHEHRIPWSMRIEFLILCMRYRSQWKSWVGLWLPVAYKYLTSGEQSIQELISRKFDRPPHAGILYYERRKFSTWVNVKNKIELFTSTWRYK